MSLPSDPTRQAIGERLSPACPGPEFAWRPAGGGLSGAAVWRVECDGKVFAVRRWPGDTSRAWLGWLHKTLRAAGDDCCATPLDGDWPFGDADGRLWEAAAWRSGSPLAPTSPDGALEAATAGLATFHRRLAEFPLLRDNKPTSHAQRREQLSRLASSSAWHLDRDLAAAWPQLIRLAERASEVAPGAAHRLTAIGPNALGAPQLIHGDARPDHFLIEGGRLTGLIDFGAMRVDSVLADVARLAGEVALGDRERFTHVVRLYVRASGRPLDAEAVAAWDRAAAVLSATNWVRWLGDPGGPPRDDDAVRERLDAISARLR